jgi:hypothetical protein
MKKIIENLYLGDQFSAPDDTQVIINCAEELFPLKDGKNLDFINDQNHWYFNFKNSSTFDEINLKAVDQCLQVINEHWQKNEKIYVHCLWGVNRSASIVFMYLVKNDFLKAKNFRGAIKEFKRTYPPFSPNAGWFEFLQKNYPFTNL